MRVRSTNTLPKPPRPASGSFDKLILKKLLEKREKAAGAVHSLFSGRERVFAKQHAKGTGYSPEKREITPQDIIQHLKGERTVGAYLVKQDNIVSFGCLDVDVPAGFKINDQNRAKTRAISLALKGCAEKLGIPILLEDSGNKGFHLWLFFEKPVPATLAKKLGKGIIDKGVDEYSKIFFKRKTGRIEAPEVFPKQTKVRADRFGNLVKLPLGVHQKTGRRCWFLDKKTFQPLPDQVEALKSVQKLTQSEAEEALRLLESVPPPASEGEPDDKKEDERGASLFEIADPPEDITPELKKRLEEYNRKIRGEENLNHGDRAGPCCKKTLEFCQTEKGVWAERTTLVRIISNLRKVTDLDGSIEDAMAYFRFYVNDERHNQPENIEKLKYYVSYAFGKADAPLALEACQTMQDRDLCHYSCERNWPLGGHKKPPSKKPDLDLLEVELEAQAEKVRKQHPKFVAFVNKLSVKLRPEQWIMFGLLSDEERVWIECNPAAGKTFLMAACGVYFWEQKHKMTLYLAPNHAGVGVFTKHLAGFVQQVGADVLCVHFYGKRRLCTKGRRGCSSSCPCYLGSPEEWEKECKEIEAEWDQIEKEKGPRKGQRGGIKRRKVERRMEKLMRVLILDKALENYTGVLDEKRARELIEKIPELTDQFIDQFSLGLVEKLVEGEKESITLNGTCEYQVLLRAANKFAQIVATTPYSMITEREREKLEPFLQEAKGGNVLIDEVDRLIEIFQDKFQHFEVVAGVVPVKARKRRETCPERAKLLCARELWKKSLRREEKKKKKDERRKEYPKNSQGRKKEEVPPCPKLQATEKSRMISSSELEEICKACELDNWVELCNCSKSCQVGLVLPTDTQKLGNTVIEPDKDELKGLFEEVLAPALDFLDRNQSKIVMGAEDAEEREETVRQIRNFANELENYLVSNFSPVKTPHPYRWIKKVGKQLEKDQKGLRQVVQAAGEVEGFYEREIWVRIPPKTHEETKDKLWWLLKRLKFFNQARKSEFVTSIHATGTDWANADDRHACTITFAFDDSEGKQRFWDCMGQFRRIMGASGSIGGEEGARELNLVLGLAELGIDWDFKVPVYGQVETVLPPQAKILLSETNMPNWKLEEEAPQLHKDIIQAVQQTAAWAESVTFSPTKTLCNTVFRGSSFRPVKLDDDPKYLVLGTREEVIKTLEDIKQGQWNVFYHYLRGPLARSTDLPFFDFGLVLGNSVPPQERQIFNQKWQERLHEKYGEIFEQMGNLEAEKISKIDLERIFTTSNARREIKQASMRIFRDAKKNRGVWIINKFGSEVFPPEWIGNIEEIDLEGGWRSQIQAMGKWMNEGLTEKKRLEMLENEHIRASPREKKQRFEVLRLLATRKDDGRGWTTKEIAISTTQRKTKVTEFVRGLSQLGAVTNTKVGQRTEYLLVELGEKVLRRLEKKREEKTSRRNE
ncbi:MAG: hypothetical protein ACE5OZ_07410 [Candidatus Heimdallarchaeota archaeon]